MKFGSYDLDLEKVAKSCKGKKLVLLQFPDGLKPYATAVVDYLEKKTDSEFLIWLGDCFGACDVPDVKADLVVQFGHNKVLPNF